MIDSLHRTPRRHALACSIGLALTTLTTPRAIAQAAAPLPAAAAASAPPAAPGSPAAAPTTPSAVSTAPRQLQRVTVTGNPLGSSDIAAPVSVLSGEALVLRRGSSLGDTLSGLPGVASTYFGPNANRPTIRGLDGDRVRILSNAGASLDASSLSFDHAVPIDPLIVDRIEVLRGPGALFYGGSAVGGVVNTLDNRIPVAPLAGPSGAVEGRLGGAERERGGAAIVEYGNATAGTGASSFALHADVFGRDTSDLRVPRHVPIEDGAALPSSRHIRNSASETRGGALGGALFFGANRIGLAVDTYDSTYGTVVEEDVVIKMKRDHIGAAADFKNLAGPFTSVRTTVNHTRYEHREIDGAGVVGTTFKTDGSEARIEAEHRPIGRLKGVLGAQFESNDFSALGDEAFVPATRTRKQALFVLEETAWRGGTASAGLRYEHVRVESDGDADPATPRFGAPARRSFGLTSASLSNVTPLAPTWSVTGSLSATQRAPTSFELYANGVHAATAAFEVGDPSLGKERGVNVDAALQWRDGANHLRAGVFGTRFSRFISLEANGSEPVDDGGGGVEDLPRYEFRAVRARLRGVEVEGQYRLAERPWTLDATGQLDLTRAENADTGEPLPRVAPLRARVGLDAARGPWSGRVEVDHAARQSRVPASDTATAGYTLVNLSLARRFNLDRFDALWFLKLTNLGDRLGYSASSVATIRGLAPLPGRAVKMGVRVSF